MPTVEATKAEDSAQVRERIERSRRVQREKLDGAGIMTTADMGPVEVWKFCQRDESANGLLQAAMKQMHLSARGFHRILKVSRTIADLAGTETIGIPHAAEALQYRHTGWG